MSSVAVNNAVFSIEDFKRGYLECIVCSETYNNAERVPKLLPCSHILCLRCIKRLHSLGPLKCPQCCELINIPNNDPEAFTRALHLMQLQDWLESQPTFEMTHSADKENIKILKGNVVRLEEELVNITNKLSHFKNQNQELIKKETTVLEQKDITISCLRAEISALTDNQRIQSELHLANIKVIQEERTNIESLLETQIADLMVQSITAAENLSAESHIQKVALENRIRVYQAEEDLLKKQIYDLEVMMNVKTHEKDKPSEVSCSINKKLEALENELLAKEAIIQTNNTIIKEKELEIQVVRAEKASILERVLRWLDVRQTELDILRAETESVLND